MAAVTLAVVVLRHVPRTRAGRIDVAGMLLFTAAIGAATYGLTRANEGGMGESVDVGATGGRSGAAGGVRGGRDRGPSRC